MSANVNKYYRRVITNCPTSRQPSYWQQIYGTRPSYFYSNIFFLKIRQLCTLLNGTQTVGYF